jgi:hypothetical protein
MRSGRTTFLGFAFVLCGAAAYPGLRAADSAPAPAPVAAPEKIEFSRSSSTTPRVPRPGEKSDDLVKRFGNVREGVGGGGTEFQAPMAPVPAMPSKAAAEKMLRDWDKKKNWLVPGAQDTDPNDPLAAVQKAGKDWTRTEKEETVMERYFNGRDSKKKAADQSREHDLDDSRDNPSDGNANPNDRYRNSKKKEEDGDSRRDPNDNSESNGLAEFNLKNFIRQQSGQQPFVKDNLLPKSSQLFRADFANRANAADRARTQDKEKEAARSAEFMQMLKPRGSAGAFVGANDPIINAPDLTRKEMNPVTPSPSEASTLGRSPFATAPSSPAARMQENNMFGAIGPAAASGMAPSINTPLPRVDTRPRPIVIEPPKRPGF